MTQKNKRGGAVSILTAGALAVMLGSAAIAVDIGSVFLNARQLQGAADLAAIAAAQDINAAQSIAAASVKAAMGGKPVKVTAEIGNYVADPKVAPDARFQAGAAGANAVRVHLERNSPLFFGSIFAPNGAALIGREAIAAQAKLASFQIGSRLAALDGGAANALLTALTGSNISLTVMDYNALATVNVDLFDYLDAVRTKAHLTGASYDEVLTASVETGVALRAIADVVTGADKLRAADALTEIGDAAGNLAPVRLGKALNVGAYGPQDTASLGSARRVSISALDLSNAVLEIANGGRQVQLDLGAGVPGLADVKAWLAIGERPNASPWLAVTRSGDPIIRTAQMRLYIDAKVGVAGLSGIAQARLPLLVELASAQAKLTDITCGANPRVSLSVAPSIGSLTIADIDKSKLNDFKTPLTKNPAKIVSTLLLSVEGSANADLGGETWTPVNFDMSEIRAGRIKQAATHDLFTATTASLVDDMTLSVHTLGFGANASAITTALAPVLKAAAPPLDSTLNTLEALLGIKLGEAEVRVNGLRCVGAALVG